MFSTKKKGNKFTVNQKIIPSVHRSKSSPVMGAEQGEISHVYFGVGMGVSESYLGSVGV